MTAKHKYHVNSPELKTVVQKNGFLAARMRLRNQMRQGMDALWKQNVPPASIDTTMKGAYRAETVWLTIRYALAWHDFPEGGQWVDFYEPMNRSDQPMPKVELKLKGEEK